MFMFIYSLYEIRSDANIESTVSYTCQYVNIIIFHSRLDSRFRGNDIKYSMILSLSTFPNIMI